MTNEQDYQRHRQRVGQLAAIERLEAINNRRRGQWAGLFTVIGALTVAAIVGRPRGPYGGLNGVLIGLGAVGGGIVGLVLALVTERKTPPVPKSDDSTVPPTTPMHDWLAVAFFVIALVSLVVLISTSASGWTPWRSTGLIAILLWAAYVVRHAVRSSNKLR